MRKSERLNDMMMYLKDKQRVSVKNIMDRYGISRSTAIRDMRSLEEIGMPIYSTAGRSGGYQILLNRLLSPIVFSLNEVYALYFAMQTLKGYQSTPFQLDFERMKQKFEGCISKDQVEKLHRMDSVFSLGSYQSGSACGWLADVVRMALDEKVCRIQYVKAGIETCYQVQFFDITSAYGQWYATGYNLQTQKPQVFRCDRIALIDVCRDEESRPLAELSAIGKTQWRAGDATDFEVMVTDKGADIFSKEHYPSMLLHRENGQYMLTGFYNKGEERFIAQYFMGFGETLLSVHPVCLKQLILERIDTLKRHLTSMA